MKNATLNWLQEQCAQNLLAEKWLLCDSLRSGQTWKDRINLAGTATVNLHSKTLRSIVMSVVSGHMAQQRLVYLNQKSNESLVLDLINSEFEAGTLGYFASVRHTDGLAKLAAQSIRDLRMAAVKPEDLEGSKFEASNKADDIQLLYGKYIDAIQERSLIDYAGCLDLATTWLLGESIPVPSELLVLLPGNLEWAYLEQQFADALGSRATVICGPSPASGQVAAEELSKTQVSFFAGYGEVNEVRAVVQRIVGPDSESAVPFDDVEIVYTDESYVPLLYEFLEEYSPQPGNKTEPNALASGFNRASATDKPNALLASGQAHEPTALAAGQPDEGHADEPNALASGLDRGDIPSHGEQPENHGPEASAFGSKSIPTPEASAFGSRGRVHPPVTYSQGIATIYSRPGRALRAWLRWIHSDGLQSKAVHLFREGVLNRPEEPDGATPIGYSRLASNLRRISIGFKLDRYLPAIEAVIADAEKRQADFIARREDDDGDEDRAADSHDDEVKRDYGLPALKCILEMTAPLVELAPSSSDSAHDVLQKAKRFLIRCARCENKLDRNARNKLLDEIDGRLAALEFAEESAEGVIAWLEDLPVESTIMGSGPQPGCVYASPIGMAGVSGRKHLFVVGMDANRFPRINRVDPLLLDSERNSISSELPTSIQAAAQNAAQLTTFLERATEIEKVQLVCSYSNRNLVEDRDQSPSPAMVEMYRQSNGLPKASLDDLLNHIGTPTSFASTDPDNWLRASDGELAEVLTSPNGEAAQATLESQYPHFAAARLADEQRKSPDFTEFDGLVPEAGPSLSPTNSESRVSPSRLETFGTCPRRFFFKYGLGAYPPDEWDIDPERWLDPIGLGNLIHGLFETFMRELTSEDRSPEARRDLPQLLELLNEYIEKFLRDIPIPNEDAFQRQKEWLEECCEIFLEKEEAYCQETGARPWVLEAAIGLDEDPVSDLDCREPIELRLKNGESIRVGGRIDRIDRLATHGSESYAIWDYKSGSDWGFSQDDPFKQGRKLQSFLYVSMLRHRLAATGGNKNAATSFGYFFPNARTQGKRIQWTVGELKQGDEILQNICTLIQQGAFPATTEPKDCKFCDYNGVCSDVQIVTAESIRIASENRNRETLGLWKELRNIK